MSGLNPERFFVGTVRPDEGWLSAPEPTRLGGGRSASRRISTPTHRSYNPGHDDNRQQHGRNLGAAEEGIPMRAIAEAIGRGSGCPFAASARTRREPISTGLPASFPSTIPPPAPSPATRSAGPRGKPACSPTCGKADTSHEAGIHRETNGRPYLKRDISKQKRPIVALVERGGGVRAVHMPHVTADNVGDVLAKHANTRSRLHADESRLYPQHGVFFADHETLKHSPGEYARGDVNTNSVEGFFGIFKRGMRGIYQHCGEQHLQRYLKEFNFHYSNRSQFGVEDAARRDGPARRGWQAADLSAD